MKLARQIVISLILVALVVPGIAWVSPDFRDFLVERGLWPAAALPNAPSEKPPEMPDAADAKPWW